MEIWAHRGTCSYLGISCAENTIQAFQNAVAIGADGLEADVRICATGEPVIYHNREFSFSNKGIKYSNPRKRFIENFSLQELKRIPLDPQGNFIPTLDEFLDLFLDQIPINLDVKSIGQNDERIILDCLKKHKAEQKVLLSAFNPLSLYRFQKLEPYSRRALLLENERKLFWLGQYFLDLEAIHIQDQIAEPFRLYRWRNQGLDIRAWTINDVRRAEELSTYGVRGVITDVVEAY